jgi:hypothetical protein
MHPMPGMSVNTATRFPDPQNMRQKSLAFFLSALISSGLFASVFLTQKYPIQVTPAGDPPQWILSPKPDTARPVMPPVQDKRITQSTKNTPARNNRRPPVVPAETTTAAALSSASTLNAAASEAQLSMETAPATGKPSPALIRTAKPISRKWLKLPGNIWVIHRFQKASRSRSNLPMPGFRAARIVMP